MSNIDEDLPWIVLRAFGYHARRGFCQIAKSASDFCFIGLKCVARPYGCALRGIAHPRRLACGLEDRAPNVTF